jgi:hypothetical protein
MDFIKSLTRTAPRAGRSLVADPDQFVGGRMVEVYSDFHRAPPLVEIVHERALRTVSRWVVARNRDRCATSPFLNSDPPEKPGVGDRNGDDTMAESAVVPRLRAARRGRLVDRRAPWAYHEMAVVDWEID